MTSVLQACEYSIEDRICSHPAWIGLVSGLEADKLLRKVEVPYTYVLRQGETSSAYYVSFVQADGSLKHQPFEIATTTEGWYYENTGAGGPYNSVVTIDHVLHLIMHCNEGEPVPFLR